MATSTASSTTTTITASCPCHHLRYTLPPTPIITHCCHCTHCQRESGAAFALNAMYESHLLTPLASTHPSNPTPVEPLLVPVPTTSGVDQIFARCPKCFGTVYSYYGGSTAVAFVRVGCVESADRKGWEPDVHIFTGTKMGWVDLSASGKGCFEEYYEREKVWSKEALARRERLLEKLAAETKKDSGIANAAEEDEGVEKITKKTEEVTL